MTVAFNAAVWCLWFSLWPAPRPGADGVLGRLATGANLSRGGALLALVANSHAPVNAAYEALSDLAEEAKKIAVVLVCGGFLCYVVLEVGVRHLPAADGEPSDDDDPESPARPRPRSRSRSPRQAHPSPGHRYPA